ncbi:hypothetical protein SAMN05444716_1292, partial [Streptomyces harbinensis]
AAAPPAIEHHQEEDTGEEFEAVSVYDLQPGDRIKLNDDDAPVHLDDLHFTEEDDSDVVELEYTTPTGDAEVATLDADAAVYRSI